MNLNLIHKIFPILTNIQQRAKVDFLRHNLPTYLHTHHLHVIVHHVGANLPYFR